MKKQVIEYAGVPVGITVPDGNRIKFIAVKYPVIDLDGGSYDSVRDLQAAIHEHVSKSAEEDQAVFVGAANDVASNEARSVFNAA
ncbi:hypothetical protein ACSV9I_08700 [Rhizobium sp. G187]|uniref:hypothetical protein n=1 Tax=Rhizobium sp. G187 TaxID=3451352 RepID=UPI003EE6CDA6